MDGAGLAEKMDAYVDRSGGADACWPWTRGRSSDGYGRIYPGGGATVALTAHRVAYELEHGVEVPNDMEVLHACDNPPCCNPAHLSVGTHAQNMAEMAERGRSIKGARNPRRKVTDEQIEQMLEMKRGGARNVDIGERFGVSGPHVSKLLNGVQRAEVLDHKRRDFVRRKLTDDQVAEIRTRRAAGERRNDLAAEFGVAGPYISQICKGQRR